MRVSGSASFEGAFEGTLHLAGATYVAPGPFRPEDHATLRLEVQDARVLVVRDPILRAHAPGLLWWDDADPRDSEAEEFAFTGSIVMAPNQDDPVLLALPARQGGSIGMAAHGLEGIRLQPMGGAGADSRTGRGLGEPAYPSVDGRSLRPEPAPAILPWAQGRMAAVEGDLLSLAYGSRVQLAGPDGVRTIQTGLVRHQSAGASPLAEASSLESVFLVVEAAGAQAAPEGAAGTWELRVQGLEGSTRGEVRLAGTEDRGSQPRMPGRHGLVQVAGDLRAEANPRDGAMDWTVEGSATYVGVDGVAVKGERGFPWAAAAGGLGLLAALLVGLRQAFPGFLAGYHKARPLGNVTRVKLLLLAGENPGITASRLSEALGVGRPTVFFHARVLRQAGLLRVHREGSRWHFSRAGEADGVPPQALPAGSASAAAALQQPVRRAVMACVAKAGGALPASRIRGLLAQDGLALSPSHLAYHLSVLAAAGALRKGSDGTWSGAAGGGVAFPPPAVADPRPPWDARLGPAESAAVRQALDELSARGLLRAPSAFHGSRALAAGGG